LNVVKGHLSEFSLTHCLLIDKNAIFWPDITGGRMDYFCKEVRPSKPHRICQNPLCNKEFPGSDKYCPACRKRLERHKTLDPNAVPSVKNRPKGCSIPGCTYKWRAGKYCMMHRRWFLKYGDPLGKPDKTSIIYTWHACATPTCAGKTPYLHCGRCEHAIRRGIDPSTVKRRYRHMCLVAWCAGFVSRHGYCAVHRFRHEENGDALLFRDGTRETSPTTCRTKGCEGRHFKRGYCYPCLRQAARNNLLLREYLASIPGHKIRTCIGRKGCGRNAVLFGRCPDCLYDWQFCFKVVKRYI
jgi:hypothetical protein